MNEDERFQAHEHWKEVAIERDAFLKLSDLELEKTYVVMAQLDYHPPYRAFLKVVGVNDDKKHRTVKVLEGSDAPCEPGHQFNFYEYKGDAVIGSGAARSMLASKFDEMPAFPMEGW